tara:strand:- start:141 stop:455 length:315 start_codon:yes stop_codon:yes gene_type:complete
MVMAEWKFEVERPSSTPPTKVLQSKQRWEYMVVYIHRTLMTNKLTGVTINGERLDKEEWKEKWTDDNIHLGLNELGMDGWRITGMKSTPVDDEIIYLERPRKGG